MSKITADTYIQPFPTSLEVKGNKDLAPDSIAYETGFIAVTLVNPAVLFQGEELIERRVWVGPKEEVQHV